MEREWRFEAMYRAHARRVLAYAVRRAPVETAKDAVAETFLVAWRRLDDVPADPLPWLIQTTRRTLANERRASARQSRVVGRLAHELDPGGDSPDVGGDPAVRAALARLGARDREALTLLAWEGLTPSQAARSLGCSPVTFRVRLHRARRRLEAVLAEEEGPRAGVVRLKEAS